MEPRQFVHLGYSKVASTFLQSKIFLKNPEIYFYGKNNDALYHQAMRKGEHYELYKGLGQEITNSLINLERFSGLTDEQKSDISFHYDKAAKDNKPFVWSNEHFCESVCPFFIAKQFKELLPNPHFIIFIRNQVDIVKSMYRFKAHQFQFAPKPYFMKYIKFSDWIDFSFKNNFQQGGHKARDWVADYLRIVDYDSFVSIFESVFSTDRIHIVPLESCSGTMNSLNKRVCSILNVPVYSLELEDSVKQNVSNNSFLLHNIKSKSKLLKKLPSLSLSRRLNFILSKFESYDEGSLERIREHYATGNKKLSERYHLDLDSYDYF